MVLATRDKQQIKTEIANAYAEGVRAGEARAHGAADLRNTDGTIDWRQVAAYVAREKDRLPARTREKSGEFIADMATRAESQLSREPTQRQHEWLHDLFFRLGGKIA